jgi:hypothetical protein
VDTPAGRLRFALGHLLLVAAPPLAYHGIMRNPFNPRNAVFILCVTGPPTLCFLGLAGLALWRRGAGFRLSRRVLWTTAVFGYTGLILPAAMIAVLQAFYPVLKGPLVQAMVFLFTMPACVPLLMLAGLANAVGGERKRAARVSADW